MQKIAAPFPLEGTGNTRELGRYRNRAGLKLKEHSLLRSDALSGITAADGKFLSGYGVRCVIDLRFPDEIGRSPDRLALFDPPVRYTVVSLQGPVQGTRYAGAFPPTMWELYCWMLDDSGPQFREVFETIARHPEECVLFHCTGGKDRTGMVAMLLLELAGVDDDTVIGDYALTEAAMRRQFILQTKELESRGFTVPQHIMQSPPENMEKALRHLRQNYGTAADYLGRIGLRDDTISRLREKLLERAPEEVPSAVAITD